MPNSQSVRPPAGAVCPPCARLSRLTMNAPWVNHGIGEEFVSGQLQGKTRQSVQKLLELHLRQEPSAKCRAASFPFVMIPYLVALFVIFGVVSDGHHVFGSDFGNALVFRGLGRLLSLGTFLVVAQ